MFLTRSRSLAAVAACVLLVAALTGCGADKAKVSSGSPTAAVSGTGVDIHQFVADVTGAMKAKGTAHMVMAIGSSAGAVADVDYTSGTAMRITMTTGPQKVNVVLTGGVMYLQQTAGGKYLKIGKSDPALGGLLTQLSNIGPTASLTSMEPGIKRILDVGTVTIDGTRLTHYEITVDTAKAASAFGAAPDALSTGQPKTVTYDMYLDSGKLLRQIDMTVSGQKVEMKVSDWGKPVSIVAPPASQVMVH
jgi:hypothetical protein